MSFVRTVKDVSHRMAGFVRNTNMEFSSTLIERYGTNIFLKREDQQHTRSFKLRGAYNKVQENSNDKTSINVCASAGNHAQGMALACYNLGVNGEIFVPKTTPLQKIQRIKYYGKDKINLHIVGSNFSETLSKAKKFCEENDSTFVHPYDDIHTIHGQATIGMEIYDELQRLKFERCQTTVIVPIGGGGLISGIGTYLKGINPGINIIGVEPIQCPSMKRSLESKKVVDVPTDNNFVDGATVQRVGDLTFDMCRDCVDDIYEIPDGLLCREIIDLYQNDGIVAEPAGALSIAALNVIDRKYIDNHNVVCIVSGGNNDIMRYPEMLNKALVYENKRHYYIIRFSQTPGELKKFINSILGPHDDIIRFEYMKKTNMNVGNVLIGIELVDPNDIENIDYNLVLNGFNFQKLREDEILFNFIV